MSYRTAKDAPFHRQWDSDSRLPSPDPGSAPVNCGPTSVENVAHFYTDRAFGIYNTRRLATLDTVNGTTYADQVVMLAKRGVPAIASQPSLAAIRSFAGRRNHPIILGLLMSQVPANVRGHDFTGWHAVEVLETHTEANAQGVLVRDPNFNTTFRPDPTHGRRFYPNWVITAAFVNAHGWAIIPQKPKALPDPRARITEIGTRVYTLDVLGDHGKLDGNWFATAQYRGIVRRRDKQVIVDRWDRAFRFHGMQHGAHHGIGAHPDRWGVLTINGVKRAVPGPRLNVL